MRMLSPLALTILLAPGLLQAQAPAAAAAPSFSQQFKAGKPEVERLMTAFEFRQAFTLAESLLPTAKPAFDKSTVNGLHTSCWNFIEAGQAYTLAFRGAESAGQWEKGVTYIAKALEIAKENQANCLAPLTEQMEYWKKKADVANALLTRNADAIKELKAKAKIEDYEQDSLERVKLWEKEFAEGDKWSKFFKYDLDMSAKDVEYYEKLSAMMDTRIKSQQEEIDAYKPHPGDKKRWVEAVIATHSYMDSIPDKGDKVALLCRLTVLDPENAKVLHELDVQLGKASPDKKAAPAKKKKA